MTMGADLKEEADRAFDELVETLNEDEDLRGPVEEEHPVVVLDPGTRIMEAMDFAVIRRAVVVQPDLNQWVRERVERRGDSLSSFVRRVLFWQVNRVLSHGEDRPEEVYPTAPGTRTEHITFAIKPPHYTLAQLAMTRWDTNFTQFCAHALNRYRQAVEEA